MSSVSADASERETHNVIASGIMFADSSPRERDRCTNASFVTVLRSATDSNRYMSDVQFYRAASQANASDSGVGEVAGMMREFRAYDVERKRLGPVIAPQPVLGCELTHAPYWMGTQLPKFGNFTWIGPYNPNVGWGMHFEGNFPLLGPDGRDVGRVGMAVSLRGLTGILIDALRRGGDITAGGHAMIITRDKLLVLGNTEDHASVLSNGADDYSHDARYCTDTYGCTVDSLPRSSVLADAVRVVRQYHDGAACPETVWLASVQQMSKDRLVSLQPFEPGAYGLPPLQDRWCIVTSIPAGNVLAASRRARFLSSMVAMSGGVGIFLAIVSLGCALAVAKRRMLALEQEKAKRAERFVTAAMDSLADVSFPIVLLSFDDMVAAGRMRSHEELRAQGKLVLFDTLDQLAAFQAAGNCFVFVSHQWLSATHPDPHGEQFSALVAAMDRIRPLQPARSGGSWYIWLDYFSVPQVHRGLMETAVSSLPVYASRADLFVILAPESVHESGTVCGLRSYFRRGWCRAEVLAKVCESGLSRTYILSSYADALNSTGPSTASSATPSEADRASHGNHAGRQSKEDVEHGGARGSRGDNERNSNAGLSAVNEAAALLHDDLDPVSVMTLSSSPACAGGGGTAKERLLRLEPFTQQRLSNFSLSVFEGEFKDDADKQRLVGPVLALYGRCLRSTDPFAVRMRLHIQAQKHSFFPAEQVDASGRRTLLFKDYPTRIEARVEAELAASSRRLDGNSPQWSSRRGRSVQSSVRRRQLFDVMNRWLGCSRGVVKVDDSSLEYPAHVLDRRQDRESVASTSESVHAAYPAGAYGRGGSPPVLRGDPPWSASRMAGLPPPV